MSIRSVFPSTSVHSVNRRNSTHFNHAMTFVKGAHDVRQGITERFQKGFLAAVSDPHPKQFPLVLWAVGEVKEILILAHHDPVNCLRMTPNRGIQHFIHLHVEDVLRQMAMAIEKKRQGFWKLVIYQKLHALWSTT